MTYISLVYIHWGKDHVFLVLGIMGQLLEKKTQQSDALKSSSLLYVIERTFVSTLVYLIIELLEYVRSRKISIAFKTLTLNIGPITLQGPHHVAQKSMMISLWPALFSKSSSSSWKGMNQQTTAKAMKGHRVFQTKKNKS